MSVPDPPMTGTVTVHAACGTVMGSSRGGGAALFAGIPFARPPVGDLRLRPPQPVPHESVLYARAFRPAPPQPVSAPAVPGGPGGAPDSPVARVVRAMAALGRIRTSEDCLYLNVWTPDASGTRPVVVWLYGGGFEGGSAAPPLTDGARLSELADVVVVAPNYRVGALGFAAMTGIAGERWRDASNLGLQDQVAALAWVRDNVAAFGGDPANVTIAGESAGAFSVGTLLTMPAARGLFHKAILQSGSTGRAFPPDVAERMARDLWRALDVSTVAEVRRVPVDAIVRAQGTVIDHDLGARNLPGGRSWGTVLDGLVVPEHPHAALARGGARDIPLLVGANSDEARIFQLQQGASFVPADEERLRHEMGLVTGDPDRMLAAYRATAPSGTGGTGPASLGDLRSRFLSDAVYRRPVATMAAAQVAAGGTAWSSLFAAAPLGPALGGFHGADLLYTFDRLGVLGLDSPGNLRVRDEMVAAWAAFAHRGAPGWPAYAPGRATTRVFGGPGGLVVEPAPDAVEAAWQAR